jgi:hypothetical protein
VKAHAARLQLLWMAGMALMLTSCAVRSHYRLYPGPFLPKDQVAYLITDWEERYPLLLFLLGGPLAHVASVDGEVVKGSWFDGTIKIEVLPGSHEVEVFFAEHDYGELWYSNKSLTLSFYAVPGHTYLLRANASDKPFFTGDQRCWNPTIVDVKE